MTQSLEQFRQQVLQNQALADQFKAVSSPDAFADLAVRLGRQLGYDFTAEDVKAALDHYSAAGALTLSDNELESIAAGGNNLEYGWTQGSNCSNPTSICS